MGEISNLCPVEHVNYWLCWAIDVISSLALYFGFLNHQQIFFPEEKKKIYFEIHKILNRKQIYCKRKWKSHTKNIFTVLVFTQKIDKSSKDGTYSIIRSQWFISLVSDFIHQGQVMAKRKSIITDIGHNSVDPKWFNSLTPMKAVSDIIMVLMKLELPFNYIIVEIVPFTMVI